MKSIFRSAGRALALCLLATCCAAASAATLTITDPMTGGNLCTAQLPSPARVSLESDSSTGLEGLWLDLRNQNARAMKVSLGDYAQGFHLDARGAGLAGAVFDFRDQPDAITIKAQGSDLGMWTLKADATTTNSTLGLHTLVPPLVPTVDGTRPYRQVVRKLAETFDRGESAGLAPAQVSALIAQALDELGL